MPRTIGCTQTRVNKILIPMGLPNLLLKPLWFRHLYFLHPFHHVPSPALLVPILFTLSSSSRSQPKSVILHTSSTKSWNRVQNGTQYSRWGFITWHIQAFSLVLCSFSIIISNNLGGGESFFFFKLALSSCLQKTTQAKQTQWPFPEQ